MLLYIINIHVLKIILQKFLCFFIPYIHILPHKKLCFSNVTSIVEYYNFMSRISRIIPKLCSYYFFCGIPKYSHHSNALINLEKNIGIPIPIKI